MAAAGSEISIAAADAAMAAVGEAGFAGVVVVAARPGASAVGVELDAGSSLVAAVPETFSFFAFTAALALARATLALAFFSAAAAIAARISSSVFPGNFSRKVANAFSAASADGAFLGLGAASAIRVALASTSIERATTATHTSSSMFVASYFFNNG